MTTAETATIEIYDPHSEKTRTVTDLQVRSHDDIDAVTGETKSIKGIQFLVMGNQRTWPLWIPYEDFTNANPDIDI